MSAYLEFLLSALRPANPGSRLPRPVEPPDLVVPAQHSLGLDDHQVLSPHWPEAPEPYPNNAILTAEARVAIGPEGDLELVAGDKVLKGDITTGPRAGEKGAQQQQKDLEHPAGYQPARLPAAVRLVGRALAPLQAPSPPASAPRNPHKKWIRFRVPVTDAGCATRSRAGGVETLEVGEGVTSTVRV